MKRLNHRGLCTLTITCAVKSILQFLYGINLLCIKLADDVVDNEDDNDDDDVGAKHAFGRTGE